MTPATGTDVTTIVLTTVRYHGIEAMKAVETAIETGTGPKDVTVIGTQADMQIAQRITSKALPRIVTGTRDLLSKLTSKYH